MKNKSYQSIISIILVGMMMLGALSGCFPNSNTNITNGEVAEVLQPMIKEVKATKFGEYGIEPESEFEITLEEQLTEKELYNYLLIEPSIGNFSLTGSGTKWKITPEKPLDLNKVYAVRSISPKTLQTQRSFAFQTRSNLQINSSYPSNEITDFPANGSIMFDFNLKNVDISKHFTISPEVKGKFIIEGYSVTFVPEKGLESNTNYIVTIGVGAKAGNGVALESDYSIAFSTGENPEENKNLLFFSTAFTSTHITGEKLWLSMFYNNYEETTKADELTVRVLSYPTIDQYQKDVRDYYEAQSKVGKKEETNIDSSTLEQVVEYQTKLFFDEREYARYLILPEDLEVGQYLVEVDYPDGDKTRTVQKMFAISDYNIYMQSGNNEFLAWVNSTKTGESVSNATISLEEAPSHSTKAKEDFIFASGVTGADGTVTLEVENVSYAYFTVTVENQVVYFERLTMQSGRPYYRMLDDNGKEIVDVSRDYFSYLYTDRTQYQPNDTIKIWGTLQPRKDKALPSKVQIKLSNYRKAIEESEFVEVDSFGTFSTEITFEDLENNYYTLEVLDKEGSRYSSNGVSIREYEKPTYSITVTTDKEYYFVGEEINLSVSAQYYDGTPVSGKKLSLFADDFSGNEEAILDNDGKALFSGVISAEGFTDSRWAPTSSFFQVSNAEDSESQIIASYTNVRVLPSRVASTMKSDLGEGIIEIETALIDMGKINTKDYSPYGVGQFEFYKGEPTDIPLTVEIKKQIVTKAVKEEYYDAVNRKTVTIYDYDMKEEIAETIETRTENGKVKLEVGPYPNEELVYYWVEFYFTGEQGLKIQGNDYFYGGWNQFSEDNYTFFDNKGNNSLAVGKSIELGIYLNNKSVENKGRVLFTTSQENLEEVGVYNTSGHTWTMKENNIPNVSLAGAYFDGKNIYTIAPTSITYDYSDKELELTVTSDKEKYKPGETAQLLLSLKDSSGNPVAGSAVVGIVDESAFAVSDQSINLMSSLYQSVYYPSIYQFTSSKDRSLKQEGMADAMAPNSPPTGGGDSIMAATIRKHFVDTALFKPVTTDATGKAVIEVELPDNITSWRITAMAVTSKVEGGQQISHAVTTLPYYINTAITPTYLTGDDIVIAIDGVGVGTVLGESMDYSVEVTDDAGDIVDIVDTKSSTAKVGSRLYVNLDKLEAGNYKVLIRGGNDDYQDAVERDIIVLEKGLSVKHTVVSGPEDWKNLQPQRYPVEITAFDKELKPYFDALTWLNRQYGERSEVQVAGHLAENMLYNASSKRYDTEPQRPEIMEELLQTYDAGFFALPKGQGEVETTAKIMAVANNMLYTDGVRGYFNKILESAEYNASQRAMALMGLALVEEPVLLDIQHELKANKELSDRDRLYLGVGLASLGEYDEAEKIYNSLAKKLKIEENTAYLDVGTRTQNDEITAGALMLTSYIHHPIASKMVNYFVNAEKDEEQKIPYHLEILAYAQQYKMPAQDLASSVTYLGQSGNEETVTFGADNNWASFTMNKKDFEGAEVTYKGDVEFLVTYRGFVDSEQSKVLFHVQKTYVPDNNVSVGGLMTVQYVITPTEDTPNGYYTLNDYLPSGMRYFRQIGIEDKDNEFFYVTAEGQRIRTGFYYSKESNKDIIYGSYRTSNVLLGEFVSEGCIIINSDGEISFVGENSTVRIDS